MKLPDNPRIALIGCGAIAERFHLPALVSQLDARQAILLVDPNAERRNGLAEQFGVAHCAADYRELEDTIDGVVVATPPPLHYPVASHFLRRGVHVLCEKPLAESAAEAHQLVMLAREAGVTLAVNQTRRLFPIYKTIREEIAAGALGQLKSISYHEGVEFNWPAASSFHFTPEAKGVLSDTGIHVLDTICWWLAAKPELRASWNDSHGGPEAVALVWLRHDECEIDIKVSRLARLPNCFRIEGTNGTIEASVDERDRVVIRFPNGRTRRLKGRSETHSYEALSRPLIANFVDSIKHQAEPLVAGESTLAAVELLELAYQQAGRFELPWNRHWKTTHVA